MPNASSGDFRQAITAWFNVKVAKLNANTTEVVADAVEAGENITKHNIETRGTAKSGKRGRVETGKMRDSVTHDVRFGKGEVLGRFGYENAPGYTPFQEEGFDSWVGVTVEGTYALADAADEVLKDFIDDMDKAVKKSA